MNPSGSFQGIAPNNYLPAVLRLSVIIVNYNVKFFLEQALLSVKKATRTIPAEIFVVDNSSVDGSADLVHEKFPDVIFIENKDNAGFAKANNQAIRLAKGELTKEHYDKLRQTLAAWSPSPQYSSHYIPTMRQ